jgi:hypothetical protein
MNPTLKSKIKETGRKLHYKCISVGIEKGIFPKNICEKEIEDRYVDVFDIIPENISSSVLVISINPSSADLDSNQEPAPCHLHFIPEEIKAIRKDLKPILNSWNSGKNGKKLCYPGYFNRIYKLFQNTDFYPLFVDKQYNENWIKLLNDSDVYNTLITEEDQKAIKALENKDLSKKIVITDLIPLKETDSKKVNKIMEDAEVKCLTLELLSLKMELLNPQFSLILFKSIQKELMSNIDELFNKVDFDHSNLLKSGFIRYMPESKWLNIKDTINSKLGTKFPDEMLSDKWSYLSL